jgi:predicted  nucleic acid-binding Zn-ribbon protein
LKDQIVLVLSLHELDAKVRAFRETIDKMQPEAQALEALAESHRVTREEKSAKLAETEKAKRSNEVEVETSEARLKEFSAKLSQIKTNKEYQAALKEISETKRLNKQMEDQILTLMSDIETLKKDLQAAEEALGDSSVNLEKKRGEVAAEEAKLAAFNGQAQEERAKITAQIDSKILAQYERVNKSGKVAVAAVVTGTCQGCRMRVPPQLFIEIQKLKAVHYCPNCLRLLYLPEWQGTKDDQPPQEASV